MDYSHQHSTFSHGVMNPLANEIRRRPTRPNFVGAEPLMTVVLGTRQGTRRRYLARHETREGRRDLIIGQKNNCSREVTARGQTLQVRCHRFLMSSEECDHLSAVTRQIAEIQGNGYL